MQGSGGAGSYTLTLRGDVVPTDFYAAAACGGGQVWKPVPTNGAVISDLIHISEEEVARLYLFVTTIYEKAE